MTANAQTYSSITPSRCIAVADENPAIWYPMHDGTGTTLAEALGLGPSMTLAGTTPANGWSNAGAYTPNGTDNVATCAANAHVDSVMSLANIAAGEAAAAIDLDRIEQEERAREEALKAQERQARVAQAFTRHQVDVLGQLEAQQKSLWVQFALGGSYQMLRVSTSPLAKPSYLAEIGNQCENRPLNMP